MAARPRVTFVGSLSVAVLPALLGLCVLPAPSHAGSLDFVPTPYRNSLTLDAAVTSESNEAGLGGLRRTESDVFVKEKLTFVSDGYSYHPRFIQYHLLLAAALKQEDYEHDGLGAVDTSASGFDYDLRLNVLPEHPYKLRLFTSRTEPLYRQYSAVEDAAVSATRGAVFSFRKKPYFLTVRYIDSSREWARGASDSTIFGTNGLYSKELEGGRRLSFSAFYEHVAARPLSGPGGSAENYGVGNTIDLSTSSLQSNVSGNSYRPDAPASGLAGDGFTWLERLNLKLPLHLTSLFTYRYQRRNQTIASAGASSEEVRSVDTSNYELDLIHKLYRSLETTYRLRREVADSAGGETAATSHSLSAIYTKNVPSGTLSVGANVSRADTDSAGRTTVAGEAHTSLGLNEVFTTLQRQADCDSVRVFLTDHANGDRPVPVNFTAVPSPGDRCDIVVISLPPDFDETTPHDYTISYTLATGDYALRTEAYGYNASLSLFHNNVIPYVSQTVTSAQVVSGSYPGTPFEGSVVTIGLVLGSLPLRITGEFQQRSGSAEPFQRWRGELNYNQSVTTTTYVALAAAHIRTEYPEGSTAGSPQPFTDETTRISGNLQQRLFHRSLVLAGGGSYTSHQGLIQSSGYTLHATLQWRIGKTTVTAGANEYRSSREGLPETRSERVRQYYFLSLRREIF